MNDPRTVWLNVAQAATYAGVTKPTIRLWMSKGLKYSRLGHRTVKISDRSIDEFIESFEETSEVSSAVNKIMGANK